MIRAATSIPLLAGIGAVFAGCSAPKVHPYRPTTTAPAVTDSHLLAADGTRLPLTYWPAETGQRQQAPGAGPKRRPRAVIVALHGMNDHKGSFAMPAESWRLRGIAVYAYDQRGFGAGERRGIWPGVKNLVRDLSAAVAAVRRRHPGAPVYLVGSSMGGGVILAAMGMPTAPRVAGIVLAAPAVWARASMPRTYRVTLRWATRLVPWMDLSAGDLGRRPTDNLAAWRATATDPLIIRGARVDAVWGVVNLMDAADTGAPKVRVPVLLLYGARDEIIPKRPVTRLIGRLPADHRTVAYYPRGWHWLFRDLQRWAVHDDVAAWILKRPRALPSGAAKEAIARLKRDLKK